MWHKTDLNLSMVLRRTIIIQNKLIILMKNNKYKKGYKIELLREVLDQINNSDSFALIGMPGIGKTDFFQTLQKNKNFWLEYDVKPPKFSFIFIFIDLNNLLGPSPLEFYKYTIHEVAETLITNLENKELIKEIQENLEKAISSNDLSYQSTIYVNSSSNVYFRIKNMGQSAAYIIPMKVYLNGH